MNRLKHRVPVLLGWLAYLVGVINIAAVFIRPLRHEADIVFGFLPAYLRGTALASSLISGAFIITIARGLKRRKKRARNALIFLLLINITNSLTQLIVQLLLVALLILFRSEFYAKSDPTTRFRPLLGFLYAVIISLLSSFLLLFLRHRNVIVGDPSFAELAQTVIQGLFGVAGPVQYRSDRSADLVNFFLGAQGLFILLVPLWLYFKRVEALPTMSEEDREAIKKLARHDLDQDSLGYFATRHDKSVVWASNRKAAIAYRVVNGVLLAAGDPVGEFSCWPDAMTNFVNLAKEYAWTPAVMGASDRSGRVWVEKFDMQAFEIGDEAIIHIEDFTLEGRPMSNVRQMVNRIKRNGYTARTAKFIELDPVTQDQLRTLADRWRYGVADRGFSMSMDRFGAPEDSNIYVTYAEKDGEIRALLRLMPWSSDSLSLDRMQRERGIDPGVNELMIVTTVEFARENGLKRLSLNFAAFRSLFNRAEKISAGPLIRTQRNMLRFISGYFQLESLYRFNAKFQPEWQTRYILYPKATDLPRVGTAAIRAESFVSTFNKHKH